MNHKQAERKRKKAQLHSRAQYERKMTAIREVLEKLRSDKKTVSMKKMSDEMKQRGYVSDGRGGWRPVVTPKQTDNMAKE